MIHFKFIEKDKAEKYFPILFDILYSNMNEIAPTGEGYDADYKEWSRAVGEGLTKEARQIILICDDETVVGFFQYYVNDRVFMMEEIQFVKAYKGTGLFRQLYAHLCGIIPSETPYVEAFAHKNNIKSQGILKHLGLEPIGENRTGNSLHFRGDCQAMLDRYR